MLMEKLTSYEDDFRPMESDRLVTIVVDGEAKHWLMSPDGSGLYPVLTYRDIRLMSERVEFLQAQIAVGATC